MIRPIKSGHDTLLIPQEEAKLISDYLADGICFLAGFEMAKGELPFELSNLREAARELNIAIKKIAYP